jgi:3-oxoacyl-[acyl-carrier-protein] synthase II
VITGIGAALRGIDSVVELLDAGVPDPSVAWTPESRLGRRGWRYKDRATRLALVAAKEALDIAGPPDADLPALRTGVVASSNLGNLDTVCRVAAQLASGQSSDTSPMDLPNASSNVVASTVAAWFGLKGANLMLCNGATSGIDALQVGATMIRAGRADRMVVVGVEPGTAEALRFLQDSARQWLGGATGLESLQWGEGAAALVLEAASSARRRGARIWARIGQVVRSDGPRLRDSIRTLGATPPALWLVPPRQYAPTRAAVDAALHGWPDDGPGMVDLTAGLGETYGALGVLQAVVACLMLARTGQGWAAVTSGGFAGDAFASAALHAVRPTETLDVTERVA